MKKQNVVKQESQITTSTPDGKIGTSFATPQGLPDHFSPPLDVFRAPGGKRAAVRGCDTRPRKSDGSDPAANLTILCSFPDGKGATLIDGDLDVVW